MLIDTHAHINMMVKSNFDIPLTEQEIIDAQLIVDAAQKSDVTKIINIGTSLVESYNCVRLAQTYDAIHAVVGIHPNDLTDDWKKDLRAIEKLVENKTHNKIVGIGECGMDFHYPDYNLQRQQDAFRAQIEMSLEHTIALVVHTRDASDETLRVLEEYVGQITHGVIHCFSEQKDFAHQVIEWGFALGIGGIITYPKNNYLREIVKEVPLESIVLETDSPFLPLQTMRGKQQSPQYIKQIAEYVGQLRNESVPLVSSVTTQRANKLFNIL